MKRCVCGEEVYDWQRFHWVTAEDGHYVDGVSKGGAGALPPTPTTVLAERRQTASGGVVIKPKPARGKGMKAHLKRASELFGAPPHRAPPFTAVPAKPWGLEADVRGAGAELLGMLGYAIYDLEQGFRKDGSSRVTEGIADQYFIGHGLQGWIEYKRWDNEPSNEQYVFAAEVLAAGGIYLLVYDVQQLHDWHGGSHG